jgi:hypothetical protein
MSSKRLQHSVLHQQKRHREVRPSTITALFFILGFQLYLPRIRNFLCHQSRWLDGIIDTGILS